MRSKYTDAHKHVLQVFIARSLISEEDATQIYLAASEKVGVSASFDQFPRFIRTINEQLDPLFMEIRIGKSEETGKTYYCLVNCLEDEPAKFATDFSAQEIEFIKKVIEVIVLSPEGCVSSIELINLVHDLPKKITPRSAEELLIKLTSRKWLDETKGNILLGPRAVIELGQYLESRFGDRIKICIMCHNVVILGDICMSCDTKMHKYCAATKFSGISASKKECPSCKQTWEKEVM